MKKIFNGGTTRIVFLVPTTLVLSAYILVVVGILIDSLLHISIAVLLFILTILIMQLLEKKVIFKERGYKNGQGNEN